MAAKVKILPTSRVGVAPLAEMAQQLRSFVPGWEDTAVFLEKGGAKGDLREDLEHLAHHDADGLLVASLGSEVVGFVGSFVRSRCLLISQLWVLPEHLGDEVASALFRRALQFGERSGTNRVLFQALTPWQLALGLQFSLTPLFPLLRLKLSPQKAQVAGHNLARMLPGAEVTGEAVSRRAFFADLERLDRLGRGFARPMDHEYWLFSRNLHLAVVREGERITAYAYGGAGQCGPVVGATEESALTALGWALQFAANSPPSNSAPEDPTVELLLPTSFGKATDHLMETGPEVLATSQWLVSKSTRYSHFIPASFSLV